MTLKRLAIGLTATLALVLAVALAPTLPDAIPDGTPTAAAQGIPANASCVGALSSILGQNQLRDETSALVIALAQILGVPPGALYSTVARLDAGSTECATIFSILQLILAPPGNGA